MIKPYTGVIIFIIFIIKSNRIELNRMYYRRIARMADCAALFAPPNPASL